jgi:hypothetical protein
MVLELFSLAVVALVLNRKSPTVEARPFDPSFTKIRCPLCQWQPTKDDRWFCDPGCLHVWNTFATAGLCPGCAKQWEHTACLQCKGWSLHEDWYEHD